MKQKVADLELELASCQHRRGDVICELRVTNLLDDHKYMLLGQAYETVTRAVDDHGAIFPAIRVKLGDKDGKQYAEVILPSTVPVSCEIQFSGVPDSTALFSLVEIHFTDDWNTRPKGPKFQFRSVPIT